MKFGVLGAIVLATLFTRPAVNGAALREDVGLTHEIRPLLNRVLSEDNGERYPAVREFLGLRESISQALIRIVEDANRTGTPAVGPKASAIYLMGELGLVQCLGVLERERNWMPPPPRKNVFGYVGDEPPGHFTGKPAERARQRLRVTPGVSLNPRRTRTDLLAFPKLAELLGRLNSPEMETRMAAERSLIEWSDGVSLDFDEVLSGKRDGRPCSNALRVTAAFVQGELRSYCSPWEIDLRDEQGTTRQYEASLSVQAAEPDRPCVIALLKTGMRRGLEQYVTHVTYTGGLTQETRDRVVRTILAVDRPQVTEICNSLIAGLQRSKGSSNADQEKIQERLDHLASVKHLLQD